RTARLRGLTPPARLKGALAKSALDTHRHFWHIPFAHGFTSASTPDETIAWSRTSGEEQPRTGEDVTRGSGRGNHAQTGSLGRAGSSPAPWIGGIGDGGGTGRRHGSGAAPLHRLVRAPLLFQSPAGAASASAAQGRQEGGPQGNQAGRGAGEGGPGDGRDGA